MNIKMTLIVVITLFICGCNRMTPAEQVKSVKVCQSAGLDYVIEQNAIGITVAVDCRKSEIANNDSK